MCNFNNVTGEACFVAQFSIEANIKMLTSKDWTLTSVLLQLLGMLPTEEDYELIG